MIWVKFWRKESLRSFRNRSLLSINRCTYFCSRASWRSTDAKKNRVGKCNLLRYFTGTVFFRFNCNFQQTPIFLLKIGKYYFNLKVDFEDNYTSLPLKNLAVWSWFTDYCYEADFILKLDDDVLINPFKLMDLFKQMTEGNEWNILSPWSIHIY